MENGSGIFDVLKKRSKDRISLEFMRVPLLYSYFFTVRKLLIVNSIIIINNNEFKMTMKMVSLTCYFYLNVTYILGILFLRVSRT